MTFKEFKTNLDNSSNSLDNLKELANQMLWYIRTLEKPTDRPEGRNTHSIQKSLRWYMKKTSILIDEVFIDKVDYKQFYKLKLECKPDRKTKIETEEQIQYLSKTFNVDIDTFCFDYYFEVENIYCDVED